MKWETVTSSIGQTVYTLWNNGRKLSTLVFNSSSNAARIEYANERRVFLIRDEGFLKNKTVLRNEYGIRIGHTGSEHNEKYIELNDERYFYSVCGAAGKRRSLRRFRPAAVELRVDHRRGRFANCGAKDRSLAGGA